MQVGAVLVFEAGPLALRSGGIDVERVRAYTAERLAGSPLVAGDAQFDADYAVRHVALPRPGDERQLKRLAARLLSQALDPERAPFELWLVEGLDDARFALIAKADAERCRGAGLLDVLLGDRVQCERAPEPRLGLLRRGANTLERALANARSPLAGGGGPNRRVDWLELPAAPEILAALAGGLRAFLARRGVDVDEFAPRAHLWPADEVVVFEPGAVAAGDGACAGTDPLRSLAAAACAAARGRPADLTVADLGRVPEGGALLGARLRAWIPLPALTPGHGLAVALTRCAGRAVLGFSADAVALRDLALLADAVAGALDRPVQVDSARADGQPLRSYEAQA
jgi:hypothetical protein